MRLLKFVGLCLGLVVLGAATVNVVDTAVYQALFRPWTRATSQLPTASAYTGFVAYNTTKSVLTVSDGTEWRSASPLVGSGTYDFPVLGNNALDLPCAQSWAVTVAGAALGDSCSASSNLGGDGGSLLPATAWLTCEVTATSAVKFKLCVSFTDAGTYNLHDAGFTARVTH